MIYLEDIIIFEKKTQHIKNVEDVTKRLVKNKFRVNHNKLQFCYNEFKILGKVFNGEENVS